jgi:hypothetical protein
MKHNWIKCAAVVAAVVWGSIEAQATWTYSTTSSSGEGTLSDGDYTFNVKLVTLDDPSSSGTTVTGLQITGLATAGTGETIDFTSAKSEAGYDVISLADANNMWKFLNATPCKTFIAPAMMDLGRMTFRENKVLESITVSDKITTFGYYVFENASNLKTFSPTHLPYITKLTNSNAQNALYKTAVTGDFEFPNLTNLEASQIFYGTSITSVKMPQIQKISDNAFRDCKKLTGDFKFDNLESVGSCAFMGCNLITSFVAPKAVLGDGGYEFSGCSSLTNIVVWNEMTVIGRNTFEGCQVTSFDFPKVTEIGLQAFQNCSVLTNLNTPAVTILRNAALYGCKKVTKIDMPKLELIEANGVRDMGLFELIAPNVTRVGDNAFMGCKAITNIQLGAACATNYGDRVYENCEKLVKLEPWPSLLNVTNTGVRNLVNPMSGCKALVGSIELSGPAGLHTIPKEWMDNCNSITSITIRTPWITNVVNYAVQRLAPGAVIYWNTEKAPISFGQSFFSVNDKNRTRIFVKGDMAGWSNAVYNAGITDSDKTRSDYPGKKTFGRIRDSNAYLVLAPQSFIIRIQ